MTALRLVVLLLNCIAITLQVVCIAVFAKVCLDLSLLDDEDCQYSRDSCILCLFVIHELVNWRYLNVDVVCHTVFVIQYRKLSAQP